MAGRMWSNGKMFSVAGKKGTLALVSCYHHVDSPRRRSARSYERNRSAPVSCSTLCDWDLCSVKSRVASYRPLRTLGVAAWVSTNLARYVKKIRGVTHSQIASNKNGNIFDNLLIQKIEAIIYYVILDPKRYWAQFYPGKTWIIFNKFIIIIWYLKN